MDSKARFLRIDGTGTRSNRSKHLIDSRLPQLGDSKTIFGMDPGLLHLHGFEETFPRWIRARAYKDGFEPRHNGMDTTLKLARWSRSKVCSDGFEPWLTIDGFEPRPCGWIRTNAWLMESKHGHFDGFEPMCGRWIRSMAYF